MSLLIRASSMHDDSGISPEWLRASTPTHLDPETYVPCEIVPDEIVTRRNADRCRPHPIPGRPDPTPEIDEESFFSDPGTWEFAEELRICEGCGEPFLARSHNHRCCSPDCHATTVSVERVCAACGKRFLTQRTSQRFCGQGCAGAARRNPENDRSCEWCGEPYHATRREQRFCSRPCANAWKREVRARKS